MNIKDLQAYIKKILQKNTDNYIANSLIGSAQNGSKRLWSYIKSRKILDHFTVMA